MTHIQEDLRVTPRLLQTIYQSSATNLTAPFKTPASLAACGHAFQLRHGISTAFREPQTTCGILSMIGIAAAAGGTTVAYAEALDEKSFIMIKPDGVQRGLIADIIKRFEAKGYKLVGIKILKPSVDIAQQHYAEHEGKPFYPKLVDFLTSGPVVAMVWEGKEVIKTGRGLIGATNPLGSAPGTIRGDFGIDLGRNIIHGSDSVDSAQKEIALWFRPDELADYSATIAGWVYEARSKL